jgi:hypothetical protein
MTYTGVLGERRVWTGIAGIDLRIAAIRRGIGLHEIETSYVVSDRGKPVAEHRHTMSVARAVHLAAIAQDVLSEAAVRIENDGDRDDREQHIFAERWWFDSDGMWTRVAVVGEYGDPLLYVDWGIATEEGVGALGLSVFAMPYVRALEVPRALTGAALIAHSMNDFSIGSTAPEAAR